MAKGYLNDLPLQTNLAAESSTFTVIFDQTIVAATRPDHVSAAAHDEFSGAACGYRLERPQ
jgi:hypothetical protein